MKPRAWLLAGLVLLCLVPRTLMAWKLDTVCRDGVLYIQLAEALECGDVEAGLGKLRLNTYPPLLALAHGARFDWAGLDWAPLDWEWAGKCWGACVSSLVVLPLFGWARRQFDDRLATVACLLYAVHPKLIEWSPELVRDPTFWFFWTLSLYTCWRAAAEARWAWCLAAGAAITLASHTRFEGWCLYLPLVWWSACHRLSRREPLRTSIAKLALSFAVCPLLITLVNVTWLAGESRWELGNFSRLEYVALWLRATIGDGADPSAADAAPTADSAPAERGRALAGVEAAPLHASSGDYVATPLPAVVPQARMSYGRSLWAFTNALRRGIGALFGLLWLVGFAAAPRTWLRRDQVVLFVVAALVVVGIWIHLWYAQATSSRYFLPLVLIACPCAARGWLRVAEFVRIPFAPVPVGRQTVAEFVRIPNAPAPVGTLTTSATRKLVIRSACIFLLLGACGVGEALADRHDARRREAALGRWVLREYGPGQRLVTSSDLDVLAYYARGSATSLAAADAAGPRWLAAWHPDIAVLTRRGTPPERLREFVAEATASGLRPLDFARLPPGFDWADLVVLER